MAKAKAKPKRMSVREKAERAEIRKELRESGVISPKKKPLNRKKFVEDALADQGKTLTEWTDVRHLHDAIGVVIGYGHMRPTLETVGAAKVIKVACEVKRFEAEKQQAGQEKYLFKELYERIKPILEA